VSFEFMRINPTLLRAGWRATWPSRGPIPTAGPPRSAYWTAPHARGRGVAPSCPGSPHRLGIRHLRGRRSGTSRTAHQVDNHASCRSRRKPGTSFTRFCLPSRPPSRGTATCHITTGRYSRLTTGSSGRKCQDLWMRSGLLLGANGLESPVGGDERVRAWTAPRSTRSVIWPGDRADGQGHSVLLRLRDRAPD